MTKHTIRNPNIDRTSPEDPRQPVRRDREAGELEHERGGRAPDLVPPGQVVESEPDVEDEGHESQEEKRDFQGGTARLAAERRGKSTEEPDPQAVAADRANARTSDRTDGRDGVDASDQIGRDLETSGNKRPL